MLLQWNLCFIVVLTSIEASKLNSENVNYMDYIFVDCSILISIDVSKFNTQNANYMKCMFDGCSNLTSIDVYDL